MKFKSEGANAQTFLCTPCKNFKKEINRVSSAYDWHFSTQ